MVLKGVFSETTYVCMCVDLRNKFQVSGIILTSFRQGGNSLPPPTSKRTPKEPTQISVKLLFVLQKSLLKIITNSLLATVVAQFTTKTTNRDEL